MRLDRSHRAPLENFDDHSKLLCRGEDCSVHPIPQILPVLSDFLQASMKKRLERLSPAMEGIRDYVHDYWRWKGFWYCQDRSWCWKQICSLTLTSVGAFSEKQKGLSQEAPATHNLEIVSDLSGLLYKGSLDSRVIPFREFPLCILLTRHEDLPASRE